MGMTEQTYYHLSRNTYLKIQEINKYSKEPFLILNGMVWEDAIFLENKKNLLEIAKIDNGVLYQLPYKEHYLFFIREYQENPYRNNIFWVNVLKQGTLFDNHKDETIITYKFGKKYQAKILNIKGKSYIGVHTGNLYNRYCQLKGINSNLSESEKSMWADVTKFLSGEEGNMNFVISRFKDYLIVYGIS